MGGPAGDSPASPHLGGRATEPAAVPRRIVLDRRRLGSSNRLPNAAGTRERFDGRRNACPPATKARLVKLAPRICGPTVSVASGDVAPELSLALPGILAGAISRQKQDLLLNIRRHVQQIHKRSYPPRDQAEARQTGVVGDDALSDPAIERLPVVDKILTPISWLAV